MAAKQVVRLALVALGVIGAVASGAAQQSDPKISPKDRVVIEVPNIFPKATYPVDSDGTISFPPLTKPLKVTGMTTHEVETAVSNQLFTDGWFTVHVPVIAELDQIKNKQVFVSGAVREPGIVPFAGEISVREALLLVGSTTPDAGSIARITRAASQPAANGTPAEAVVVEVNLHDLETGKSGHDVMLEDGDTLYVAKAAQVYIDGYVGRPGAYSVDPGMTLKQVITLAGGISERGAQNRIEILRGGQKVKSVKYEKTVVLPGDTITVKSRIW